MANLTQTELKKIYRKARHASRTRRTSPSATIQAAPGAMPLPRLKRGKGTVKPKATRTIGLGEVILLLGALGLLVFVVGVRIDTSARMTQTATVAVDHTAWGAMLDAQSSADGARLERLEQAGRIFTLEKGTIVEMVGVGIASRKVRVVDGEAEGRAGWVHSQFVELR